MLVSPEASCKTHLPRSQPWKAAWSSFSGERSCAKCRLSPPNLSSRSCNPNSHNLEAAASPRRRPPAGARGRSGHQGNGKRRRQSTSPAAAAMVETAGALPKAQPGARLTRHFRCGRARLIDVRRNSARLAESTCM